MCVRCGHPLLFHEDVDPYTTRLTFQKKVRYLCGLFGHRVDTVATRDGFVEYACHCGHTFLRAEWVARRYVTPWSACSSDIGLDTWPGAAVSRSTCAAIAGTRSALPSRAREATDGRPMRLALARRAALLGAAGFFLWMFLAAAPLETLAATGGLAGRHEADVVAEGYRVAADWRHGMAGNSPLYMPGFFALAVAAWFWADSSRTPAMRLIVEGGEVAAGGACRRAALRGPCGRVDRGGVRAGRRADRRGAPGRLRLGGPQPPGCPPPPRRIVFVVACRRALALRSLVPLACVPAMAIVLASVRPWTANDFVALWIVRAVAGDAVAIGSGHSHSWSGIVPRSDGMVASWVHTHWSARRTGGAR